jgi:alkylation response protein AidB-like acyl-CoA dehydrogenase
MAVDLFPPPVFEDAALTALRREVRAFVAREIESGTFRPAVDSWMTAWDAGFTRRLAARGWLGMTIPAEYGGHGRSYLERFVVTEELLAVGAPVTAHWFADRQVAPALLRFGTEAQRRELLPGIAAGTILFAIGMSEPDSGSDLAGVRTRATPADGGWQVVDLRAPGVEIRPIRSLNGEHHFNEVHFDGVHVPDSMVLGEAGNGWQQVTSELGFERSGPERFLSTQPLLEELVTATRAGELPAGPELGRLFARVTGLHQMSISVAGALQRGEPADVAAGVVKHLGTGTEGDLTEYAAGLLEDSTSTALRAAAERSLAARPGYTLRGGTNEILRGVIARGLGLR